MSETRLPTEEEKQAIIALIKSDKEVWDRIKHNEINDEKLLREIDDITSKSREYVDRYKLFYNKKEAIGEKITSEIFNDFIKKHFQEENVFYLILIIDVRREARLELGLLV